MDLVITCPNNCAIREYSILHMFAIRSGFIKFTTVAIELPIDSQTDFPARLHPLKYANASGWRTRPARMPARITHNFLLVQRINFSCILLLPLFILHLSPPFGICHNAKYAYIIWKISFNVDRPLSEYVITITISMKSVLSRRWR